MGYYAECFIKVRKKDKKILGGYYYNTISLGGSIMGYGDKEYLKQKLKLEKQGWELISSWFENTKDDIEMYRDGRMSYSSLSKIDQKCIEEMY